MFTALARDFRYGLRRIARKPGLAATIILSLAIGIGANSAIFSVIDAILFRPLPVRKSQELVALATSDHHSEYPHGLSYGLFRDFRTLTEAFSDVLAFQTTLLNFRVGEETRTVISQVASANYFSALGVEPFLGLLFQPQEASRGPEPVVVFSHALWQSLFAADPAMIGNTVWINGSPYTLIGVTPPAFRGVSVLSKSSAWVPLQLATQLTSEQPDLFENRDSHALNVWARLQEGTPFSRAEAAVEGRTAQLQQEYPATDREVRINLYPEWETRFEAGSGESLAGMSIFLGGVALFVLLIACSNVANLLLSQASGREREVAVRLAVGASRRQLIRQLLAEGLIVSLAAGCLACLLAWSGSGYLTRSFLSSEELGLGVDITVDGRVLLFTLVVSILAALFFSLVPALQTIRPSLVSSLRNEERIEPVRGFRIPLSKLLVSAQVAACFVLLVFAALFVQTLGNAQDMDLGIRKENMLLGSIYPSLLRYDETQGSQLYEELLVRLRARPEVEYAAFVSPLAMDWLLDTKTVIIDGRDVPEDGHEAIGVLATVASDGYFEAAGTTLERGRVFDSRDTNETRRVAVINQTMADLLWEGREAIGSRFWIDSRQESPVTVIGIARDGKYRNYDEPPQSFLFLPLSQNYEGGGTVLLTGPSSTAQRAQVLRQELADLDSQIAVQGLKDVSSLLSQRTFAGTRMATSLLSLFGVMGLALAAVGLFGVVSFSVRRRTREIGIRIALGARPGEIRGMILKSGISMTLAGLTIGLVLAFVLAQVAASVFYGVSPSDPATFALIVLVLCAASGLASFLPARRATQVDPLKALRWE